MMKLHRDIPDFARALPEIDLPFDGVKGYLMQAGDQQVTFMEFEKDVSVPEHTHEEQWEFVITGRVEVTSKGGTEVYTAGENFFVPAGVPHAARVSAGYKAMIVFNSKDRYRKK